LFRFGSAVNHHLHLHACVTDGIFVSAADGPACDVRPAFLPARPITQADLAAFAERLRCRRRPAEQRVFSGRQRPNHAHRPLVNRQTYAEVLLVV
jgi:hypothetical protein